ncbi:hypothetical protein JCM33374_g4904 [Metschnikowia sp. JCM 33374]|nr:hypothetical protein JCM33374_g4904 [Metschnikowia sp. JCM 33374]
MSPNSPVSPSSSPTSSEGGSYVPKAAAAFHYDHDLFVQLLHYIKEKNHHGLALMARQKGVPPFLRFQVWSVLLKRHPFVANPFIQPDSFEKDKSSSDSDSEEFETHLQHKIRKDLRRYMHRIAFSSAEEPLSQTESQLFDIVENSVFKFIVKWGRVIKYDSALTWIALGLAEWFPPIPHTPWVLLGRDVSSDQHTCIGSVFADYDEYISTHVGLQATLDDMVEDETTATIKFHEAYERLALVLLHSPESANNRAKGQQSLKIDKSTLPVSGGTIEERVSFFIYVFQRMLPELSQYFQEEEILNKFGSHDDEWVLWWLKYCGAKVWSRVDRGRVWDLIIGWRPQSKKAEGGQKYYADKLDISDAILDKLGPDAFWSVDYEDDRPPYLVKDDSFKDLINDLHIDSTKASPPSSAPSSVAVDPSSVVTSTSSVDDIKSTIPFCKVDPHMELLFVSLSLLKAKENTLVELDQHEIRTFLSRLPAKSYKLSDKYKQYQEQKDRKRGSSQSDYGLRYDYMDSIIYEAGELWRKWLWSELNGDS